MATTKTGGWAGAEIVELRPGQASSEDADLASAEDPGHRRDRMIRRVRQAMNSRPAAPAETGVSGVPLRCR